MTRNGSLPDASIRCGSNVSAHSVAIARPVGTLPVKATMCVPGWPTSWCPAAAPPVTHCASPAGSPSNTSMNFSVVSEVYSDGFTTTALPAARAAIASRHSSTRG
jgi:hypothetical protein